MVSPQEHVDPCIHPVPEPIQPELMPQFHPYPEARPFQGITRARLTQVMGMLRLPPETQERILTLPDTLHRPPVTERAFRPIRTFTTSREQRREF